MNVVQYTAKLDLTDNGCFDTGWRIKQGDYGNSIIVISIVNNGEPVFDSAVEPTIAFKRADGRTVVSKMIAGVNNYIYTFAGNELEISGPVVMDVKFEDSDARISTASCKFTCVEDTIGYDPTGADTYNNPVSEIAKEALEQLVSSEAWAIGKRNGIDVGPEDETYHNNAKYWSEKSGSSRLISMDDVDINSPQDKQALVYDATSQKWINGQSVGGGTAKDTTYDNSKSGLSATNVQDAIDEQKENLNNYEQSTDEEIGGIKSSLSNKADKAQMLKTQALTFDIGNINPLDQRNGSVRITAPSGYKVLGVIGIRTNHYIELAICGFQKAGEAGNIADYIYGIRNLMNVNYTDTVLYVDVVYAKADLF